MQLMDLVDYEPEAVVASDFVMLGSMGEFIALGCAVIAVIIIAAILIARAVRKKK